MVAINNIIATILDCTQRNLKTLLVLETLYINRKIRSFLEQY